MCELFTIGATVITVMDVVAVAGTVMAAGAAFSQGQGQKDQYAYQAAIENNKAIVRDRQAKDVIQRGEEAARAKKAQIKTIQGRQLVTLAGQGGDVTTGTSVDLLAETKELGTWEEQKIRNNAAREANSIRADASNMRANASMAQMASDRINPLFNAATTGLQGLGRVGAQWYNKGSRSPDVESIMV